MKIKEKQLSETNCDSLFHFIKSKDLKEVEQYGIRGVFSNNPIEQATTYKATLSKGPIGLLKMTDMWICNLIYSVGLDRYFSSLISFSATEYSEIKDNYDRMYGEGKINSKKFIDEVYEYLDRFLNEDVILEIDSKNSDIIYGSTENYELDKAYNFDREKIKDKLDYITSGVISNDTVYIVDSGSNTNANDIIRELYEEYEGLSFDYLDGYINYLNNLKMNPMVRRKK